MLQKPMERRGSMEYPYKDKYPTLLSIHWHQFGDRKLEAIYNGSLTSKIKKKKKDFIGKTSS